jgi:hypothetical protein
MTRAELIRMFALDSFCDDYEDIEQITKYMDDEGPMCGMTISHGEILRALRDLIELGYAKAWDLSTPNPVPPKEYPGMPRLEELTQLDTYFLVTQEGLEFHKARSSRWPFDDDNNQSTDWVAPEASIEREELIRLFALDSFWDRYMNIEHIRSRLDDQANRCGITISRDEMIQALGELIELGYAKAWHLDRGEPPREYAGMPAVEDIKPFGAYFYITQEGMKVHLADNRGWPFDDEGELLRDWVAPVD